MLCCYVILCNTFICVPFFLLQASCYSFEDSSTTPESARWPTPCPPCPALESSSSIERTSTVSIVTFFLLFSEMYCLVLSNQIGTCFGQYKIYFPPLVWNSEYWEIYKTPQTLVVNCQVLFAVMKCVMYKWMPYLLFCMLVAVACTVPLFSHQGAVLFASSFTSRLSDEVICLELVLSPGISGGILGLFMQRKILYSRAFPPQS